MKLFLIRPLSFREQTPIDPNGLPANEGRAGTGEEYNRRGDIPGHAYPGQRRQLRPSAGVIRILLDRKSVV